MSERDREQLRRWLQETESDEEGVLGVEEQDEVEVDHVEVFQVYSSDGEEDEPQDFEMDQELPEPQEVEMDQEEPERQVVEAPRPAPFVNAEFYIGKDKETRWYLESQMARTCRTPRCNIIPTFHRPGPKGRAKNANTHLETFSCIIDDQMIDHIVNCTNIYIDRIKNNYARDRDAKPTDRMEIKSLIGILLLAGVMRSSRRNVLAMWDLTQGTGVEAIYVTMSLHRFRFLLRCLRFDDVRDRALRTTTDKLAHIRDIFEKFLENSKNSFNPSDYVSVDEQLVGFRGNCPFRVYMPNKPAKYGIKIYALVSASNFYTVSMEVYVGTQPDGPYKVTNSSKDLVLRLVEPIRGSNRNVTADNWFASLELAVELLDQYSLTFVATIRANRRVVPSCFLKDPEREVFSSMFGFHTKATLVSYVPKRNKVVLAISTMHKVGEIDANTGDQRKPVIITTYNDTKYGVDILDKMCVQYDCARNSRRWPLTIFFHLLNVGGVNALNIYRANQNYEHVGRSEYLTQLALDLMKPAAQRRINLENIPKNIRTRGKLLFGGNEVPNPQRQQQRGNATKGRCTVCPRSRDKTTRKYCDKCDRWVCPDHQKIVCEQCFD